MINPKNLQSKDSDLIAKEFQSMIKNVFGVKRKTIAIGNPQENADAKQIHQEIGNIIETFKLESNYKD
jgi:hypothetical protein